MAAALMAPQSMAQGPTPSLEEINEVARELYCPLCNGVRLDNCDLLACIQMRQVISEKLVQGLSKEQIKADFEAQYGPTVLGEPPRRGFDLIGWIVGPLILIGGAIWLFILVRRWTNRPAAATTGTAGLAEPDSSLPPDAVSDDYLTRIEAELAQIE